MNIFDSIMKSGILERLIWSVVAALLNITIYLLISRFLRSKEKKNSKIFSEKKNKTYLRMLRSIAGAALSIMTVLEVLQIFGVNVSSMLAGVGIASIVVGFALQDAMKDIIRGLEIISDSYYDIGDVVKYGDNTGEVLSIGLRTTRLRDINTMNTVSIANRNIDQVEIVSSYLYVAVPLPYEVKPTAADFLLKEISDHLQGHPEIKTVEYQGLNEIAPSALNYQLAITCDPLAKQQVNRIALATITEVFSSHHLRLPYSRLNVLERKLN